MPSTTVLLIFVSIAVAWNAVNCVTFEIKNSTDGIKGYVPTNFTSLEIAFKKKYMGEGKGYAKWEKLQEMKPIDFSTVCEKYALTLSKNIKTNVKAEGKASFRDRYTLMGCDEKDAVEVDTLTCLIRFLDKNGTETSQMKYYLTEGDEPNSAFRFSLLQTTMVLTRFLTDIWSKESKSSDPTVSLNTTTAKVLDANMTTLGIDNEKET